MIFDAKAEADTVTKLGDQALNQSTQEAQSIATTLLTQELQSLMPDQVREVKGELDQRYTAAREELHHANVLLDYAGDNIEIDNAHKKLAAADEHIHHQPTLNLVESHNKIYGITVHEKEHRDIFVPTPLSGQPHAPIK